MRLTPPAQIRPSRRQTIRCTKAKPTLVLSYSTARCTTENKKADVMEHRMPSITSAYFLSASGVAEMPFNQSSDEFMSLLRTRIEIRKLSAD